MKKIIAIIMLICIISTTALASSLQNQVNKANENLKDAESQLSNNKSQQNQTLAEINSLENNINSAEDQIETIESEISNLESKITIAQENIKYMEEELAKQDDLINKRLVAKYKSGSVTFWDVLFSSKDIEDLLYKYKALKETMKFDNELLEEVIAEKQEIENDKLALEEDIARCAELKAEAEIRLAELEEKQEIRKTYLSKLENDEEALEASIDALKEEADRLAKELAEYQAKNGSSTYEGGTMVWPLPGHYIITSPYGNRLHPVLKEYKLHTGVDIAGSGCNGDPVVAAAAGTVIKATWNTAYGNYIIIDHGGGITTLYAHSSKLLVKAGDKVEAGQEIMKVGSTGYSTGPHLHFEVRIDGKYQNPLDGWIKH